MQPQLGKKQDELRVFLHLYSPCGPLKRKVHLLLGHNSKLRDLIGDWLLLLLLLLLLAIILIDDHMNRVARCHRGNLWLEARCQLRQEFMLIFWAYLFTHYP